MTRAPSSDLAEYLERRRATWAEYVAASAKRGESSRPKLTYDGAMLEIMSPSLGHEKIAGFVGDIVKAYCFDNDIEVCAGRSWTLRDEAKRIGLEPDECFLFKDFETPVRPDLALEVAWARGIGDKLGLYAQLRVSEVWVWQKREISIYVLGRDGYEQATKSIWVPGLDVERVAAAVYPASTFSVVMRHYRGK
jgi:Uma2 family endonuclease